MRLWSASFRLAVLLGGCSVVTMGCDQTGAKTEAEAEAAPKPDEGAAQPAVLTDDPDKPVEVGDLTHDPESWDGRRIIVRGRARPFGNAIELVDPAPRKALRVMLGGELGGKSVGCVRTSDGTVACTPDLTMGEVYDVTGELSLGEDHAYTLVPEEVAKADTKAGG
ncbi:hypothetical protein PPSIR1_29133 [Plesiocystis pacifica SIR-1]|uniref:Lipoprotein n=1 Tax=Plesiocystis pacifica SIR-1 TaxID=391625 RepID=A6GHV8_9BACT|nr:hypothetical protein PPSIR1_29133 [Plesiocystis pacifica SIR-1]